MKLFLESGYESDWAKQRWREISAEWEELGIFTLCDSAERADAVLVTLADPRIAYAETIRQIARSDFYNRRPDRCFVFDTQDVPIGLYAGFYSSLRRYLFSSGRHRTGCYMQSFNEFIRFDDPHAATPRYLFSFLGNLTSRTRASLFARSYGRDDVLIERTQPFWEDTGGEQFREFKRRFMDTIANSKFVLCPRGVGTSSFRLFESMQSGRVPVVISDAWVPPPNVDWASCSLRVRERDIDRLPDLCDAAEPKWRQMGLRARAAWEQWFSPVGIGWSIKAGIEEIGRTRRFTERLYRLEWPLRRGVVELRRLLVRAVSRR